LKFGGGCVRCRPALTFDSDARTLFQQFSWASELEKWTTIPAAHIKLIRSRNDCDALRGADVVILTYGMLSDKAAVGAYTVVLDQSD
jgi:hypothetical protein